MNSFTKIKSFSHISIFLLAVTGILNGCYAETYAVAPDPVIIPSPPPGEIVYTEYECPEGYVWVGDYYDWNGYSWVLIRGGCQYRPGYIWVAPTYIYVSGGVRYVPGYWKPKSGTYVKGYPHSYPKKYNAYPPPPPPASHHHNYHPKVQAIPKK